MPRTFPAVTRALIQAEKTKRRIERAQFDFVARQSVRAISRYKRLGYSPVVSWRELSTLTHAKLWQNPKFRTVTPGKFRGFVYKAAERVYKNELRRSGRYSRRRSLYRAGKRAPGGKVATRRTFAKVRKEIDRKGRETLSLERLPDTRAAAPFEIAHPTWQAILQEYGELMIIESRLVAEIKNRRNVARNQRQLEAVRRKIDAAARDFEQRADWAKAACEPSSPVNENLEEQRFIEKADRALCRYAIEAAVARLERKYQKVHYMREYGHTWEEIGALLGEKSDTLRRGYQRKMRKLLTPELEEIEYEQPI